MTLGVNAVSDASAVYIKSVSPNLTSYTKATSGGATETATFGIYKNAIINASLSGSKTTGDVWTLTVKDSALSGGAKNVNYTVQSSDTLTTIASSMATAVNADTALQAIGVSASSAATVLALQSTSSNLSTYSSAVSGAGTEIVTLTTNPNSRMLAKVGGTKTTSDVLSIVVYDSALSGGSWTVDYTTR